MSTAASFFIERLSPLYEDVQRSGIFPDSKYFVDCTPLLPAEEIVTRYAIEKNKAGFDLRAFVSDHFQSPAEPDNSYRSGDKTLPDHLAGLWSVLTRKPDEQGGTLLALPNEYIVPGGRFREIYYWDSYFTMLGLQVNGRVDIIENMVRNFAYLIEQAGFIPNGNRTYYLGRSQPPFFSLMVSILAEEKGAEIFTEFLPQLEKEYAFWMDGADSLTENNIAHRRAVRMPNGTVLNRYWDDNASPRPEAFTEDEHIAASSGREVTAVYRDIRAAAESGWDFSSRWFRDAKNMETIQTTHLIPVDLNCLLYHLEMILSAIYESQDPIQYDRFVQKMEQRKEAILQYCWNESKGFFFDYHFTDQQQSDQYTLAATYPLFFSIAELGQSEKIAQHIRDRFLKPGGLITTLNQTGQQWDSPNGWAPLQWMAYEGLTLYGHNPLADKIRDNWMRVNEKVFAATGKMMEKYDVTDTESLAAGGEYPNQDGFGWTNGVYLKFLALTDGYQF